MRRAKVSTLVVLVAVAVGTGASAARAQTPAKPEGGTKPAEPQAGAAKPAPAGANPKVKITTTLGAIVVELDSQKAPLTVDNFIQYAKAKHYDGTIFHRVMPNFMIQGGGHLPDLSEKKEGLRPPVKNESTNGLKNDRGTIAMARTNDPDSATCQFFINVVDNHRLDGAEGKPGYTVFGKVVEGMDVVDAIKNTETKTDPKYPGGKVVPVTPVVIQSVVVMDGK